MLSTFRCFYNYQNVEFLRLQFLLNSTQRDYLCNSFLLMKKCGVFIYLFILMDNSVLMIDSKHCN